MATEKGTGSGTQVTGKNTTQPSGSLLITTCRSGSPFGYDSTDMKRIFLLLLVLLVGSLFAFSVRYEL